MYQENRKLKRRFTFITRFNRNERKQLIELATLLSRSQNEAVCIAISFLKKEIDKHGDKLPASTIFPAIRTTNN